MMSQNNIQKASIRFLINLLLRFARNLTQIIVTKSLTNKDNNQHFNLYEVCNSFNILKTIKHDINDYKLNNYNYTISCVS